MSYPIKLSPKTEVLPLVIIATAWLLGLYFYAHFPAVVTSHWNYAGQPNGYMGKFGGAFFLPALLTAIYGLFLLLPLLDPKQERYAEFANVYNFFRSAMLAVLLGIYVASGLYNLGYPIDIKSVVPIVIGLLFIVLGNFMGKIKPNWFMGIRTPWTMSSENVWNKTHRMGGFLFVVFGLALLLTPLLGAAAGKTILIGGVIVVAIVPTVYSYFLFHKEKSGQLKA